MILGTVLVLAALSLFWRNCQEDEEAGASAERILPIVKGYIEDSGLNGAQGDRFVESVHPATVDGDPSAMTEVEIDGSLYIGYLSVPALGMEITISDIFPCRHWDWNFPSWQTGIMNGCGSRPAAIRAQ